MGTDYAGILRQHGFIFSKEDRYAHSLTFIGSLETKVYLLSPLIDGEKPFLLVELPISRVPPSKIFDQNSRDYDPEYVGDYYKLLSQYASLIAERNGLSLSEDYGDDGFALRIEGDEETVKSQLTKSIDLVLKIKSESDLAQTVLAQAVEIAATRKRAEYANVLRGLVM